MNSCNNVINMYEFDPPWAQQEGEDDFEYQLFRDFRDQKTKKNRRDSPKWKEPKMIEIIKKNNWEHRARAFDAYDEELRIRAQHAAAVEMNERHADNAQKALTIAMQTIMQYVQTKDNPNPMRLKPSDAIKLMDVAVKIERLARGEPDSIVHADVDSREISLEDKRNHLLGIIQDPQARLHLSKLRQLASKNSEEK